MRKHRLIKGGRGGEKYWIKKLHKIFKQKLTKEEKLEETHHKKTSYIKKTTYEGERELVKVKAVRTYGNIRPRL